MSIRLTNSLSALKGLNGDVFLSMTWWKWRRLRLKTDSCWCQNKQTLWAEISRNVLGFFYIKKNAMCTHDLWMQLLTKSPQNCSLGPKESAVCLWVRWRHQLIHPAPPLLVLCPGLHDRGCMIWVIWSEIHDDDGYMTLVICSGLNYLGYVIWVKCSISCVWLRKIKDTFNLPLRSVQSVMCFCLSSPTPGLVTSQTWPLLHQNRGKHC